MRKNQSSMSPPETKYTYLYFFVLYSRPMPRAKNDAARSGLSKRERTRAALIDAAAALVGEFGYEGTSLEAVAARAGMSRGAIYGNFASRDDLFLAVAETMWRPVAPDFPPGTSFSRRMHILGEAVAKEAEARRGAAVGAVSFQLYALTHPAMRERLLARNREIYRLMAERVRADSGDSELPLPPEMLVKAVHALIEGLMLTHFLTPELITKEVIVGAFEALARA
jgi:AcrR family transcriptional regulator